MLIRCALQRRLGCHSQIGHRARILANADVFNFEITAEDMRLLDGFNENLRTCRDPTNAP